MSARREEDPSGQEVAVTHAEAATEAATEHEEVASPAGAVSLDELLPRAALQAEARRAQASEPRVRTARLVAVHGREADVIFRRAQTPVRCEIGQEVEAALLEDTLKSGGSVLVEESGEPGEAPVVAGVIATRIPRSVEIKASTVTIEGERELVLRSGRGAIRIREDGDIEVVGTRISATSRGLFRLVGRLLRLN